MGWDISRTVWRIEVIDGSFFCIFHALSFELNLFLDCITKGIPIPQHFVRKYAGNSEVTRKRHTTFLPHICSEHCKDLPNQQIRDEEQGVEYNSDEMEVNHYDQMKEVADESCTKETDNDIVLDIEDIPCTEEEEIDLEETSLLVVAQATLNHSGNFGN